MNENFECKQCEKCCTEIFCSAFDINEDVEKWIDERRYDILKWVTNLCSDYYTVYDEIQARGIEEVKKSLKEGEFELIDRREVYHYAKHNCPFLRKVRNKDKFECIIQESKLTICKEFPYIKDGICPNPWAVENCPSVIEMMEGGI